MASFEDRLNTRERVRLEALAQAVNVSAVVPFAAFDARPMTPDEKLDALFARAEKIAEFITTA